MGWLPTIVTAEPAEEPVTLAQARSHCRAEGTNVDDALVSSYIKAARVHVESYCGIRLVVQTVAMRCSSFGDFASLASAPLQSVTSIAYLNTDGNSQALATTVYQSLLYGLSPSIVLKPDQSWPSVLTRADAITVTAEAGYGAAAAVPQPIISAMLLLIAQWYDNRAPVVTGEAVHEMPNAVEALLSNYRRF